jgi:CRISPR-associated protein (TIGR02584 family)
MNQPRYSPASFPRRILLAVSGLTPQVVTETIHALATDEVERFIPTEVHLLTTLEGSSRARLMLLSEKPGWFHRLCADYELQGIDFPEENIHLLSTRDGRALEDIRTAEENQWAADGITEKIRELTSDANSALHVSLAGVRKTMGFFAGYALSLFGRTQDRLSHVLVPKDFESASDFFYPSPAPRVIEGRDQKPLDAGDVHLTLARIPFVSLRHGLPRQLLEGRGSYSEVVAAAAASLGPAELIIDLPGHRIRAAGKIVDMNPSALALLSVFARRAKDSRPVLSAPAKPLFDKVAPDMDWARRFKAELNQMYAHHEDIPQATRNALQSGMDGDYFSMQLSRLHRDLRRELGGAADVYMIDNGGTRPCRYELKLPADAIRFEALPKPAPVRSM